MGAWKAIREQLVSEDRPGSFGWLRSLQKAADVFAAVEPFLADREAEVAEFNADADVSQALAIRPAAERLFS